mmetsp:Transcript_42628/g.100124  ORF Transcript_42628/g.100124 Transcript_42628/m.100124 type:complete len:257 (+) Transcript_42628:897-1667(+)
MSRPLESVYSASPDAMSEEKREITSLPGCSVFPASPSCGTGPTVHSSSTSARPAYTRTVCATQAENTCRTSWTTALRTTSSVARQSADAHAMSWPSGEVWFGRKMYAPDFWSVVADSYQKKFWDTATSVPSALLATDLSRPVLLSKVTRTNSFSIVTSFLSLAPEAFSSLARTLCLALLGSTTYLLSSNGPSSAMKTSSSFDALPWFCIACSELAILVASTTVLGTSVAVSPSLTVSCGVATGMRVGKRRLCDSGL